MINPSNTKILIVDDDELIRQTLADMLEINGYRTVTAAHGLAGLQLAATEKPAVVISDIEMPVMTGFELLERFRRDPALRTIPVIVVSAKSDRNAIRKGMELGAADFITKPFSETEVIYSIRTRLEKKELFDELDAFAHTVAHDMRGPLGAILGRIDFLEEDLLNRDITSASKQVPELKRAARLLGNMLEDMLVLSGVNRQSIQPETLTMGVLVNEALERLGPLIAKHEATVVVADSFPPSIGHPAWVTQIWVNYIGNAAKYGGPKARIEVGGEPRAKGAMIRYWVQDQGPGLDAAAAARLFVPFTRISSVRALGHGLGLSIVRRIAEKLGGDAGVDSTPGAGARFWFELPAATNGANQRGLGA